MGKRGSMEMEIEEIGQFSQFFGNGEYGKCPYNSYNSSAG